MTDSPAFVAKRDEIVSRAALLFEKKGYFGTTMEDIAAAVNLSKPTLYYYFQSKGKIVFWIHELLADLLLGRIEARLAKGVPPTQHLYEIILDILGVMDTHPGHLRVYFDHHRELPEDLAIVARQKRDRYFELVEGIIRDGVDRGELNTDDPTLTTLAFFGMCNWSYQWYRPGGRASVRDIAYYFWRLLLSGSAAGSPNAPREAL